MRRALLLVAVALLLAGCGPEPGFGHLGAFRLTSGIAWFFPEAPTVLEYSTDMRGCQVLASDFSVKVNGEPVKADPGAVTLDSRSGLTLCREPGFSIPRPLQIPGAVDVEARSGGDVVTAHLEWIGKEINGIPRPPDGSTLHRGETLPIVLGPGWEGLTWPTTASTNDWPWPVTVTPPVNGVLQVSLSDQFWNSLYDPTQIKLEVLPTSQPAYTSCDAPLGCLASTDVTGLAVPLKVQFVAGP